MFRLLLATAGILCFGYGIYWRWFQETTAERAVATSVAAALSRLEGGELDVPVRLELPVRTDATRYLAPFTATTYSRCDPDVGELPRVAVQDVAAAGDACPVRVQARLAAQGYALEEVGGEGSDAPVCARTLLMPLEGSGSRVWAVGPKATLQTDGACSTSARVRKPLAMPAPRRGRVRMISRESIQVRPEESEWVAEDGVTGWVSSAGEETLRGRWLETRDRAQAIEALLRRDLSDGASMGDVRLLLQPVRTPLLTPTKITSLASEEALVVLRLGNKPPRQPPFVGRVTREGAEWSDAVRAAYAKPKAPVLELELGSRASLDAEDRSTANFSIGFGLVLIALAGMLHGVVVALKRARRS